MPQLVERQQVFLIAIHALAGSCQLPLQRFLWFCLPLRHRVDGARCCSLWTGGGQFTVTKRVDLAGPEVLLSNAHEVGARKRAICERHGLVGVFPADEEDACDPAQPLAVR